MKMRRELQEQEFTSANETISPLPTPWEKITRVIR